MLRRELAADRALAGSFRAEALLAARLSHPNIAAVIDCSEPGEDVAFIAMEYVSGESLDRLIERDHPLELDRAADLFGQILSGLEEAHAAGIVHADIKTPNVVICQTRAGDEQAKIVDFGIAVLRRPRRSRRSVCGTPEYLAPEVIRGEAPTVASDIYGAGIILYELLAGCPPFGGLSLSAILQEHLESPVPGLPPIGSAAQTARLDAIIARALAKDPDRRFRSVAELRAAVVAASVQSDQPSAGPVTIRPRSQRAATRRAAGSRQGALESALRSLYYSQRMNDLAGCMRAHELLERLYAGDGHATMAKRHREARRRLAHRLRWPE